VYVASNTYCVPSLQSLFYLIEGFFRKLLCKYRIVSKAILATRFCSMQYDVVDVVAYFVVYPRPSRHAPIAVK
jgi:hypothetical protein